MNKSTFEIDLITKKASIRPFTIGDRKTILEKYGHDILKGFDAEKETEAMDVLQQIIFHKIKKENKDVTDLDLDNLTFSELKGAYLYCVRGDIDRPT